MVQGQHSEAWLSAVEAFSLALSLLIIEALGLFFFGVMGILITQLSDYFLVLNILYYIVNNPKNTIFARCKMVYKDFTMQDFLRKFSRRRPASKPFSTQGGLLVLSVLIAVTMMDIAYPRGVQSNECAAEGKLQSLPARCFTVARSRLCLGFSSSS
jgi:hypothetical protein